MPEGVVKDTEASLEAEAQQENTLQTMRRETSVTAAPEGVNLAGRQQLNHQSMADGLNELGGKTNSVVLEQEESQLDESKPALTNQSIEIKNRPSVFREPPSENHVTSVDCLDEA